MAKIQINNPRQIINGGTKKYYFKVKGLGGPKGDKGDKGDTGSQGPQGPQGNAATVSVGSTTTLPVGYDATVTNSGSIYNAVLDFGIPQGPRGPQGAKGDKGDKGDKGEQGNTGPTGQAGQNATVYIGTTTTLNPGSQATVYNSGTENNAVLNFGIPKGEKGDTGPMPTIAQTTGTSTTTVMSQKATTDALNTKQATLTAGSNISISGSTISATDTTYTAGNGLELNGTEFSADTTVLATKTEVAPKLQTEVVTELPTTGEESKLYLTPKNYTTGTASGNPITISLGEDAGQITSAQLDGDTYQQSYTGKNLADISNLSVYAYTGMTANITNLVENTGSFDLVLSGAANVSLWSIYAITPEVQLEPNTEYTLSRTFNTTGTAYAGAGGIRIKYGSSYTATSTADHITFSTDSTGKVQLLFYAAYNQSGPISSVNSTVSFANVQLEKSSTATSFEPYVGGVPSPNPDYPQNINVVTGTQTVSVNGTNYAVNLGDIELCKLGTYQDYIYKSGSDWKVHKATAKYTITGGASETWSRSGQTTSRMFVAALTNASSLTAIPSSSVSLIKSNYFHFTADTKEIGSIIPNTPDSEGIERYIWFFFDITSIPDIEAAKAWFVGAKPNIYYPLATATDTTITDQTLITQLEAVRNATLQASNTITNTATGTNLAGDLELGYYEYDPTNRYDKWLWLDLNNSYEKLGS